MNLYENKVQVLEFIRVNTDWISYTAAIVRFQTGPDKGKKIRVAFELLTEESQ